MRWTWPWLGIALIVPWTVATLALAQADRNAGPLQPIQVDVTLSDYGINIPSALAPGHVQFHIINAGNDVHSFVIADQRQKISLGQKLAPGMSATLSAFLAPGIYVAYCPLDSHRQRGMSREVVVKQADRVPAR